MAAVKITIVDINNNRVIEENKYFFKQEISKDDTYQKEHKNLFKINIVPISNSVGRENGEKSDVDIEKILSLRKESNLLKHCHPDLFAQIDPSENPGINLDTLTYSSNKEINWTCSHFNCEKNHLHKWSGPVYNRTRISVLKTFSLGCPFCNGKKVCPCNSFATKYPRLLQQWDYSKNKEDPFTIPCKSDKVFYWICDKSKCEHIHSWDMSVNARTRNGCPYCANFKACVCNSVYGKYPELMKQWDYEKNSGIDPRTIPWGSGREVFWICDQSKCEHIHTWPTRLVERTVGAHGCPHCSGRLICPCKSIVVRAPNLMKQWDYERNVGIDPYKIGPGCDTVEINWICRESKCGHHKWVATANSRTKGPRKLLGSLCPYCTNRKICGCNSLAATYPELLKEWDYERNMGIDPATLPPKGGLYVWWKCLHNPHEHRWYNTSCSRVRFNSGCPHCSYSKLEKTTELILQEMKINYIREHKFYDCRNIRLLKFDFYLPNYQLLIELDGKQHFEDVCFNGKTSGLEDIRKRDYIKNTYASQNKYHMIRISYSEINNIKSHIMETLNQIQRDPNNILQLLIGKEFENNGLVEEKEGDDE